MNRIQSGVSQGNIANSTQGKFQAGFRPTFHIKSNLNAHDALNKIFVLLAESNEYQGQFAATHAVIFITESRRHFWSPWLHLEISPHKKGCKIFGRFSPHPSIWTAFALMHLALGIFTLFSFVGGLSQLLVEQVPWIFWLMPLWFAVCFGLWIISKVGQRLANQEMQTMHEFVVLASKQDA